MEFYGLLPLDGEENAPAYLKAIRAQLEKDGLWDIMKSHLISIVSDGAAVLTGELTGFAVVFKQALGRSNLHMHHCLSHRCINCD